MRTIRFILPVLAILPLCSCGNRRAAALLNAAESCIQDRPDSSLALLEHIDARILHAPKLQAKATLLKAMARDKTYDDSGAMAEEMETACEYYQRHGSRKEKMLAWYYLGDEQYDSGDYVNAVISFTNAMVAAERMEDWYYAGMAAREVSYSYYNTYITKDALEYMTRACEYFERAEKREHYGFAAIMAGVFCQQMKLYEEGERIFEDVLHRAREDKDTLMEAQCLEQYALMILSDRSASPERAYEMMERAAEDLHYSLSLESLCALAKSLAKQGDIEEAEIYLNKARKTVVSSNDYAMHEVARYVIEKFSRNNGAALDALENATAYSDSVVTQLLKQSLVGTIRDYYDARAISLSYKLTEARLSLLVVILSVLVAGVFLILLYKNHRAKQQAIEQQLENEKLAMEVQLSEERSRTERYVAAAEEMRGKLKRIAEQSGQKYDKSIKQGFYTLERVCELYYVGQQEKVAKEIDEIVKGFMENSEMQMDFERLLNDVHDGVIDKFKGTLPRCRAEDVKLFSYLVAGLSYTTICVLLNVNIAPLYNRVSRMKDRISRIPADAGGELLHYFK